jgi:hypothetical protein
MTHERLETRDWGLAEMGDELDDADERQQGDRRRFGQQGQTGQDAGENPPDRPAWLAEPVEGGCQCQQGKRRQQRVGVQEAGVTDEERVKG